MIKELRTIISPYLYLLPGIYLCSDFDILSGVDIMGLETRLNEIILMYYFQHHVDYPPNLLKSMILLCIPISIIDINQIVNYLYFVLFFNLI